MRRAARPVFTRADDDLETFEALPEQYTPEGIAEKVVPDIDNWYEVGASVCHIAKFDGFQHDVHGQGAVISWVVE